MVAWGDSECPTTGGIPEGTGQSSNRCAVEGISAQGQGKEAPFHPDLLLRDFILILHPDILKGEKTRYYKKMKE